MDSENSMDFQNFSSDSMSAVPAAPEEDSSVFPENGSSNIPSTPIMPEEGSPVFPGNGSSNMPSMSVMPEGTSPVFPGNGSSNMPSMSVMPEGTSPVFPGNGSSNMPGMPVMPEEGSPVFPGNGSSNMPSMPVMPEGTSPVFPGNGSSNMPGMSVMPEGTSPVFPGNGSSNMPSMSVAPEGGAPVRQGLGSNVPGNITIIPIIPPTAVTGYAQVRFLHAATNYVPLNISVGSRNYVSDLYFGTVSPYYKIPDGFRLVTVSNTSSPNRILLRKTMPFSSGSIITLAVVNSGNGIELVEIPDTSCMNKTWNTGCLRVANLSNEGSPLDFVLSDGRLIFANVQFKEVSSFKQARPATYQIFVYRTVQRPTPYNSVEMLQDMPVGSRSSYFNDYLLNFYMTVARRKDYTIYIIGQTGSSNPLQALVI